MRGIFPATASDGMIAARPRNQTADYTGFNCVLATFLQKFDAIRAAGGHLWLYFRAGGLIPVEQLAAGALRAHSGVPPRFRETGKNL
tara:strand:+ start:1088 stop:1348 length:261 start_codon:yes stop_codon:yes gene_type:complete